MALPASSAVADWPDGESREIAEAACTSCHSLNTIERSMGYDQDGWGELIATMVNLSAAPEIRDGLTAYLAEHFPPNDQRAATLVPGDVTVSFSEWVVPTLGQRSRDPVEAPDGAIWWAGQWANLIGRIDPQTGEMVEYPLPDNAMPHSVNVDEAGRVWYTGNKNGTIGRLDPATGEITEFPMPDPAARDPHTAEFDDDGILWFTLQQSNMVGRLDPASGDVRLVTMPQANARPYGIKVAADGTLWIACNGGNCIASMDPETMAIEVIAVSDPGTRVRRLDIDDNGDIWFVNSGLGRLGRYTPATGETTEWASPSGPKSHPYAIAVVDGVVWYNESGVRPDPLVRFDPASETFQSWPIPSGRVRAGILRHMRAAGNGDLLIHQSATNRIIRVAVTTPSD
ncbi:MAG: hypothetical protein AcusKO_47450 [Acuticoccus sp.]